MAISIRCQLANFATVNDAKNTCEQVLERGVYLHTRVLPDGHDSILVRVQHSLIVCLSSSSHLQSHVGSSMVYWPKLRVLTAGILLPRHCALQLAPLAAAYFSCNSVGNLVGSCQTAAYCTQLCSGLAAEFGESSKGFQGGNFGYCKRLHLRCLPRLLLNMLLLQCSLTPGAHQGRHVVLLA